MGDNDKLRCGNGDDLQIYHDGGNSVIDSNTGDLLIRNLGTTGDIYLDAKTGERGIKIIQDGAVILYHNGSERITTTNFGVEVTGEMQSDTLDVDGVSNFQGVITAQGGAVAEIDPLTDASNVIANFANSCNFTLTFTSSIGNTRTIANPNSLTAGQSGSIFLIQDGTGNRTVSWGSYWDWAGGDPPTLSTGGGSVDRIDYIVRSSTSIHAVATLNYS